MKGLIGGASLFAGRQNYSNKNQIKLACKTAINTNDMIPLQLVKDDAMLERIHYVMWKAYFTKDESSVDPANRIYLANDKFKPEDIGHK